MHRNLALADKAFARTFDVPNLNETRERELLLRTRSDSPTPDSQAALTELWMSHGKLVASIAAKYRRTDIEHDDLINAGHLGLHTAIMRYDTERFDTRLSAYAAIWIKSSIHDYIRRNTGPVRLPESKGHRLLAQSATRLLDEARKACEREGTEPTDSALHERIGQRIGLGANEVANGLRLIQGARTCLDTGEENGEDGGLPDERIPTADDMNRRLDHDRLRARIRVLADEVLGDRERRIFLDRCMADSEQVPSLDSFATRFNVSVVRVHQIEASARRKIAAALAATGYAEYAAEGVVTHLSQARCRRRGPHVSGAEQVVTAFADESAPGVQMAVALMAEDADRALSSGMIRTSCAALSAGGR